MKIDINAIGQLQPDGSIHLYDENIKFREDMTTPRRYKLSGEQVRALGNLGYTSIVSSFIIGAMPKGNDLIIAFRTGSQYIYYGVADLFDSLMRANSKGRYFWRHIRDKIRYDRLSQVIDLGLVDETDGEMFASMQMQEINELNAIMQEEVKAKLVIIDGIEYVEFNVGGVIFYNQVAKTIN